MEKLLTALIKSLIGIAVLSLLLSAAIYFYGSHTNHCSCGIFLCFFIPACLIILLMIIGTFILKKYISKDYVTYEQEMNKLKDKAKALENQIKGYSKAEQDYKNRLLAHEEEMARIKYQHCCCPKKEN